MTHYVIELAIWMVPLFVVGCIIGALLRRNSGPRIIFADEVLPQPSAEPLPKTEPAAETVVEIEQSEIVVADIEPAVSRMERPRGLSQARGGKPDQLQRMVGIGPKNEKVLHNLGFYHFDQIATWSTEQIVWVDDHLRFNGRIDREQWVKQAELLARGDEQEFARLFGSSAHKK